MEPRSLPKTALLRKAWQYRMVYAQGKRLRGPGFSVIWLPASGEEPRLGISVHGMSLAVRRNRVKRIVREFFRHNRSFLGLPADVIFAVRPDFSLDSPLEVAAAVRRLLAAVKGDHSRRRSTSPGGATSGRSAASPRDGGTFREKGGS